MGLRVMRRLQKKSAVRKYVVRLIEKDSQRVIKEYESVTLKDDVFDRFILACEAAQAEKLREAREFARQKNIR